MMKRLFAVCMVGGLLLAASTAAFATPMTVNWSASVSTDNPWSTTSTNTLTWFQPYTPTAPTLPDPSTLGVPAGCTGSWSGPTITFNNVTWTIVAWGVNPAIVLQCSTEPAEVDPVSTGPTSSGAWTWTGVNLTPTTALFGQGTSTTVITLSGVPDSGFWGNIGNVGPGLPNQDDYVKSSDLKVSATYTYTYTYTCPCPPAPVPAPGAILLASMGRRIGFLAACSQAL